MRPWTTSTVGCCRPSAIHPQRARLSPRMASHYAPRCAQHQASTLHGHGAAKVVYATRAHNSCNRSTIWILASWTMTHHPPCHAASTSNSLPPSPGAQCERVGWRRRSFRGLHARSARFCFPRGQCDARKCYIGAGVPASSNAGASFPNMALITPLLFQVASCSPPFFLATDTIVLPSLASGNQTPTVVPFTFRVRSHELPTSLDAMVFATYTTPSGEPRCAQ